MQERAACYTLLADATPVRDADSLRGFTGVAYSGGVVPNYGFGGDLAIDLSSIQLPRAEVPILLNHNSDQIVGRATVVNDGNQLSIERGTFSGITEAGKQVAGLMAEGHPWMLSVGVSGRPRNVDRKAQTKLNGREMAIDTLLGNARLLEVSFVPAGADPHAHAARLSARLGLSPPIGDQTMNDEEKTARITALEAQVGTLTTERDEARTQRDTARTELTNLAAVSRNEQIVALFGVEHGLTEVQLTAYRGMTVEQFDVVKSALSSARQDPSLFTQRATAGRDPTTRTGVAATTPLPSGYVGDPESEQLHAKVVAYQQQHPQLDYTAAVDAVIRGV